MAELVNLDNLAAPAGLEDRSARRSKRRQRLTGITAVCSLAFVIGGFNTYLVPSESMEPTLKPGDQILAMRNWMAYPLGRQPARKDIVLFLMPDDMPDPGDSSSQANGTPDNNGDDFSAAARARKLLHLSKKGDILIKRVVALPGETVQVRDNEVWVNDTKLDLKYAPLPDDVAPAKFAVDQPLKLGPDDIFVLGDNLANSDDSRYIGPIKRGQIVARYLRTFWHRAVPGEAGLQASRGSGNQAQSGDQ